MSLPPAFNRRPTSPLTRPGIMSSSGTPDRPVAQSWPQSSTPMARREPASLRSHQIPTACCMWRWLTTGVSCWHGRSIRRRCSQIQCKARVYDANATPATGVITVAAASSQVTNLVGDVAMDSAGNFAVLYESYKKSGVRPEDHLVQRYTAAGTALGKAVNNASSSIWQGARQSIAMDAAICGRVGSDYERWNFLRFRRFSSAGQKVGSQITVASSPNPALHGNLMSPSTGPVASP